MAPLPLGMQIPAVNALPIELLGHIFSILAYIDDDGPWMASMVCKHWRRVILQSPRAWSNISLLLKNFPNPTEDQTWCIEEDAEVPPRGARRPFDLWLSRSGDTPISLLVVVEDNYPWIAIDVVECFHKLEPCTHRIRNITLHVESTCLADCMIPMLPPMKLDHLEVKISNARIPRLWRGVMYPPEGPFLTNFWWKDHTANNAVFDGCFPQVVDALGASRLSFNNLPLHHGTLAKMLKLEQNLNTLEFSTIVTFSANFGDGPAIESVTLPALRNLSVQRAAMDWCASLFDWLHAPALESLTISNFGLAELRWRMATLPMLKSFEAVGDIGGAFVEFTERTPGITSLNVAHSGLHDRYIASGMRNLRHLREFRTQETVVGAYVLRALDVDLPKVDRNRSKPPVCPKLERLHFSRCEMLKGDDLVSVVRRRATHPSVSPIREVVLDECPEVTDTHVEQLRSIGVIVLSKLSH